MKGVYIIEFQIYPGMYKIGRSKNIENRYNQFKTNTAILGEVNLLYYKEFSNEKLAEKSVHQILKNYRFQKNREFFKGDLDYFKSVLDYVHEREETYDYTKFFYTFPDNSPAKKLNSYVSSNILLWLCSRMESNTNRVYLTTELRKILSKELSISSNQITNCLSTLINLNLVSKNDRTLTVNPKYFWKGDLSIREQKVL